MTIVKKVRRKSIKLPLVGSLLSFVILFICLLISPSSDQNEQKAESSAIELASLEVEIDNSTTPKADFDSSAKDDLLDEEKIDVSSKAESKRIDNSKETNKEKTVATISDNSTFSIRFIDVGQADSALVECDGHYMLIDGGNRDDSSLIYTVLKDAEIDQLDVVVGTHAHEDHGYPEKEWHGEKVHELRPHVLHLMRGQVFEMDEKKIFTFGVRAVMI